MCDDLGDCGFPDNSEQPFSLNREEVGRGWLDNSVTLKYLSLPAYEKEARLGRNFNGNMLLSPEYSLLC